MEETGEQSPNELARELEKKIREGEHARILLEQLKSQSMVQKPPMPIQRPAIDYPPTTSRIEEIPNYDLGSGHSQQVQYHQFKGATSNQQAHNFVPQTTVQPVGSNPYQQLRSQQWTPANAINGGHDDGQSQQTSHLLYSQYLRQNMVQNTSSRAASYAPFGVSSTVRPQQQHTRQDQDRHHNYSRPMAPTQEQRHVPSYQEPLHHGITASNQGQWSTAISAPQVHPSLQTKTQVPSPSSHAARTIRPSLLVHQSSSAQNFYPEAAVSQNQATVNASSAARPQWPSPHKTANRVNHRDSSSNTMMFDQSPMSMGWYREQFSLPPNTQGVTPSMAIPSTVHNAIPSSVRKGIVQPTSSLSWFPSTTPEVHRPEDLQQRSSKQTPSTMPTSIHNQGSVLLTPRITTPSTSQNATSTLQLPLSTPSTSATSRVPGPETPSRHLSTTTNGALRSVKQANKKFLASHILFGLGKRRREPDAGLTALTEPNPKRHAQQAPGQVGVGVSPPASCSVGQATQTVQKSNEPLQLIPTGTLAVSSSWQQPLHQTTQQTSQASSSSGDQQQLVHDIPSTSKAAPVASTEISEASKILSDVTPLSLHDASIVQATLLGKQKLQVPLSGVQPNSQPDIISGDHPVISSVLQPLATTSAIAQMATPPSPVPLTAPVAVTSILSSGIIENTTQPVASSSLQQLPQPEVLAKLQRSFISPVPSPLTTSAQIPQPLFLPSPRSSPGIDANDDISISGAQSENVTSPPRSSPSVKRKNRAYVLVPPRPAYLVKLEKQRMSRASLKRIRMTSRSSVSTSVAGEEDFYNAHESHSPSHTYERRAVQLACSRLQELSCKWNGCSVKMNSVDALIRHLNRQHKPSSTSRSNSFLCRWTQCGRRCNLHEKHLEKHAFLPLHCPYEDCDESFRSAPPLWKHMRGAHEDGKLKPSAQPSCPKLKSPAAIPGIIPSYMITTRKVNSHAISSARHVVVGPWVLRNIAGLERERLTRQKSKKTVRGDIPDEDASNDYDFLTAHPTRYSSCLSQPVDMKLDDLDSENISKMVDEGLILWGKEEKANSDDAQSIFDSLSVGRREHRSDQEEVEKMLAVV